MWSVKEAQQKDKIMTTLACEEPTDSYLEEFFEVKDATVFERVNALDAVLDEDANLFQFDLNQYARKVPGMSFCGSGIERVAFYDSETNLVYKRLYVKNEKQNRDERRSLYKLQAYLDGSEIRYADTWYVTTDLGNEYQVQEYIEGVGESNTSDFKSEWLDFLLEEHESVTGFRDDLFRGNFACNVGKFAVVLIDMLSV